MNKIKVLYADASKEYDRVFQDRISKELDVELVGVVSDGRTALDLIEEKRPDVIIVDTVLPMIDGIGVLEELNMRYEGDMPSVIVTSTMIREEIIAKVTNVLGAKYFIPKPYDLDVLVRRIKEFSKNDNSSAIEITSTINKEEYGLDKASHEDLSKPRGRNRGEVIQSFINKQDDSLRNKVTDVLDGLGAPAHLKGYGYLREAIVMVADNKRYIESATKYLYPEIAEKFDATSPRVERAIRHTIGVIFERGEKENLEKVFTLPSKKDKPTNLEFIAVVANRVRECSNE